MDLNFEDASTFTPEFRNNKKLPEDKQIKVSLRSLEFGHFLEIMDAMDTGEAPVMIDGPNGTKVPKVSTGQVRRMVQASREIIPQYVTVENLTNKGSAVTVEEIVTKPVFMPLAQEIIMALMTLSMPTEDETKN